MTFLRWLLSTLTVGIVLLLLTAFGLASGTAGSRWLLERAVDSTDIPISFKGLAGNLLTGLAVDSVSIQSRDRKKKLELQTVRLQWNPGALLRKQVHIRTLSVQHLHYRSSESRPFSIANFQLPEWSSPWPIRLDLVQIERSQFDTPASSTGVDQLMLSAEFAGETLQVHEAAATLNELNLGLKGQLLFSAPFMLDAQLKIAHTSKYISSELSAQGPLNNYSFSGGGDWRDPDYQAVGFQFEGRGTLSGLELSSLELLTPGGSIDGGGHIDWAQGLKLTLALQSSEFELGKVNENMPGVLDASADVNWQAQQFDITMQANGTLLGYPLQLMFDSTGNSEAFVVDDFELRSGPNLLQVNAAGGGSGLQALSWQLEAPDLSTLHAGLSGSARGEGALNGEWQQLQGRISMQSRKLAFDGNRIDALSVRLDPRIGNDQPGAYQLHVEAERLQRDSLSLDRIELLSHGSLYSQSGNLSIEFSPENQFRSRLSLSKPGRQWLLGIHDSNLRLAQWPVLVQQQTATLSLERSRDVTRAELSAYCLHAEQESICLEASWLPQAAKADLMLKALPLQRFKPWLPASEYSRSVLSGEVMLMLAAQQWNLDAGFGLDTNKQVQLELAMDASQQLSGQIVADFDQLQWLAMFHDGLNQVQGRIEAALDVSGTLIQPGIEGRIRLVDASLNLPATGTRLQNVQFTAEILDAQKMRISGEAESGQGQVSITGDARWWPLTERQLQMTLQAQDFQLLNLPELSVVTAADLQLMADKQGLTVNGDLLLDQLLLRLEGLSEQAVKVSEDARIIGQSDEKAEDMPALPLSANIKVQLGDDVQLQGMGLDVKLGGDLQISSRAGNPMRANGKIAVVSGRYTAYGQNLSLQQSYLLFNGPINQPGLDLKAQRKLRDVTVGVMVRGTLQSPQSELYSTPDMPDSDVLSYLLTGRALNSADGDDGVIMLGALTQLGIKGSAGLVEKVRNSTGLSSFEIDTNDDTGETALKLGRYLTPQLYIQYVKSIFSDSSSVQARYDINDRLYIETQSGDDRSIDLKYQFER